ncbi:MAG: Alpha/beta hydrolase fold protein [Candidatus Gottesmanbacteria bacterium GW2011_GWC2_39_8]|uniref:Alpha/beta hydrolase fold protein n=1 Tax=Candidatus Gottesmanbacteria bacterium GW2011_GWC2_39_8 TaxID=1618450 RepID=A0A0G0T988_9BACT|nr:MAG: Alpha/beta hydrolase fold protein [Candidatus Gottesmanbacteria bacterium GW2011_GWC2_39_8]
MKTQILILHGWGSSGDAFGRLKKILEEKGFIIFNPDLPGFGKSDVPTSPQTIDDYVSFVRNYILKNGLNNFVILGHSFGGRIAIKLASTGDYGIKALILAGVPGVNPIPGVKIFLFGLLSKIGKLILSPFPTHIQNMGKRILYRSSGSTDYLKAEGVMKDTLKSVVKEDLIMPMRNISVPVYLIWGTNDRTVPLSVARKMSKELKEAKLIELPGGHKLPYENPVEFASEVIDILNQI